MSRTSLQKAIKLADGQVALAKLLRAQFSFPKLKQGHIWKWLNTTKDGVPAEYVLPICIVIDWQVTPHELRPDLYPHSHDGLPENLRVAA